MTTTGATMCDPVIKAKEVTLSQVKNDKHNTSFAI